jgi:hypothetical protein
VRFAFFAQADSAAQGSEVWVGPLLHVVLLNEWRLVTSDGKIVIITMYNVRIVELFITVNKA